MKLIDVKIFLTCVVCCDFLRENREVGDGVEVVLHRQIDGKTSEEVETKLLI